MNTAELTAAYQRLIAVSQTIGDDSPLTANQRADVDWTLCHVALSDQLLALTATQIRSRPVEATGKLVVENQAAMDPVGIAAMTEATTHQDRIAAVQRHANNLILELDQISGQITRTPVTVRFHDKSGQHVGDTDMTWEDLIELRTHQHIPGHATRLAGYLEYQPEQPK